MPEDQLSRAEVDDFSELVAFSFPLDMSGRAVVFLGQPDEPLTAAERDELRLVRAALAASDHPERDFGELATAAADAGVSAFVAAIVSAGCTGLIGRLRRFRQRPAPKSAWGLDAARAKVLASVGGVTSEKQEIVLISAKVESVSQDWVFECVVGGVRYRARTAEGSPVVLWDPLA